MPVEDFTAVPHRSSSNRSSLILVECLSSAALITAVRFPLPMEQPAGSTASRSLAVWSYKLTTHRRCNEHAAVNICCWLSGPQLTAVQDGNSSSSGAGYQLRVAVGTYELGSNSDSNGETSGFSSAVAWRCCRAQHVEAAVLAALKQQQHPSQGQALLAVLADLPQLLMQDISPGGRMGDYVR